MIEFFKTYVVYTSLLRNKNSLLAGLLLVGAFLWTQPCYRLFISLLEVVLQKKFSRSNNYFCKDR